MKKRFLCALMALLVAFTSTVVPVFADLTYNPSDDIEDGFCLASYVSNEGGSYDVDCSHALYVENSTVALRDFCVLPTREYQQNDKTVTTYTLYTRGSSQLSNAVDGDYPVGHVGEDWQKKAKSEASRYAETVNVGTGTSLMFGLNSVLYGDFYCYVFTNRNDCLSYLRLVNEIEKMEEGTARDKKLEELDDFARSNSDNYDSVQKNVQDKNASYSPNVLSPSKFYISYADDSQVVVNWDYENGVPDGVQYELKVSYFYATKSVIYTLLSKYGDATRLTDGVLDLGIHGYYFDNNNRLFCQYTVENYMDNPKDSFYHDQMLVSEELGTANGTMKSVNFFVSSPPYYEETFELLLNPLGFGWSDKKPIFVGVQAVLVPYTVENGQKKYGNTLICRRFVNETLNSVVGSTFTEVGKDENGNDYVAGNHQQDSNGNVVTGSTLPGLTGYTEQLLSGDNLSGYLLFMQRLLAGVPAEIWVLISLALAVGIALLIFRYI